MTVPEGAERTLEEVRKVLLNLRGVRHCFYLTEEMRTGLSEIERRYPAIGPLTVENAGVFECLSREHVACIVKDKTFRPPPKPTVVLMNEDGVVIGKELLPGERPEAEGKGRVLYLGKDFVIFVDRGSGKGARFVLPPVPFSEVEEVEGVRRVCSSSPSTVGDMFLRRKAGLKDDPELASVLIGFDVERA